MKSILITGGAGYLGAVLSGRLLDRGYKVTVLDNLFYRQTSLLRHCAHPNFRFLLGDARDEHLLKDLLKSQDAVIPLAALVGAPACDRDPLLARSLNHESIVLLNRLRGSSQAVVSPCSNSGYGTKSGEVHCTEESSLEPISLYGVTKVEAEKELLSKPNTISLRLATVFGTSPRMRWDLLVNDFVHRALRDRFLVLYQQHFMRNFIHIEDVADAFAYCLEHFDSMKDEIYNVGLDEANISKAQLAEKIKQYVPELYIHSAEVGSDPDKRNYIVLNEKIRKRGFVARRTLEEGIQQLITACRMIPPSEMANA